MNILVLDGHENQAVAAVRALAAAGHTVSVGADAAWSKAGWSRACARTFAYPPPEHDAAAFVTSIAETAAGAPGSLILPMTERTTLPLSAARDTIGAAGGRLVLPSHDTVLRTFDKQETTRLAQALGVDVPLTMSIESEADLRVCESALRYPLVLKPRSSQEVIGAAVRTTGAPVYARNAGELRRAWADLSTRCASALAQEFVEGVGTGYFALMREGELRAEFAHRRIRDVRPTGSGSSMRVSIAPPPRVREAALAILQALGWHGVAMVEFRTRADGTPTFLEVNGRFWNSLALPVHAGMNFPALVARLAEEGDVPLTTSYRHGVRCRWWLGDTRHLFEALRGAPPSFPGTYPSRLSTLAAVLTPAVGTYHDNFAWRDPLPELGDWLHFVLHKLPRWTGQTRAARAWHAAGRPSHP
ncbi:MAG TPA: ATP-grasp domain-containing protein [Vicinamibacterales bacterium]|jgi:predicted ATP-grasp superfamily ATP-dependent carboligase|nr:ATP-grasp domain-containing protein [Vicinamibacterales bacterium]